MNEYLTEVSHTVKALTIVGSVTAERDVVIYTLAGLGEDYELFIQNETTREKEVSFIENQNTGHAY